MLFLINFLSNEINIKIFIAIPIVLIGIIAAILNNKK